MDKQPKGRIWLAERPLALAVLTAFGLWVLLHLIQRALWVLVLVLVAIILATALAPIVAFVRRLHFPPVAGVSQRPWLCC